MATGTGTTDLVVVVREAEEVLFSVRRWDVTDVFNTARRLAQALRAAAGLMHDDPGNQLLLRALQYRGRVLALLSRIQHPDRVGLCVDQAAQNFNFLIRRPDGLPTLVDARSHAAILECGAYRSNNDSTQYQRAITALQALLKTTQPLHFELYVDYQRVLLRYATSLRRFPPSHTQAALVYKRSCAQAAAVGCALLEFHVKSDVLRGAGVRIPRYNDSHTLAQAFTSVGRQPPPTTAPRAAEGDGTAPSPYDPDRVALPRDLRPPRSAAHHPQHPGTGGAGGRRWRMGSPTGAWTSPVPSPPPAPASTRPPPTGSDGPAGGGRDKDGGASVITVHPATADDVARWCAGADLHALATLTAKAMWCLLSVGGGVNDVRGELEKILRWIGDDSKQPVPSPMPPVPPGTPAAAAATATLWRATLACLQLACVTGIEPAACSDAALQYHDCLMEYWTCNYCTPIQQQHQPTVTLKERGAPLPPPSKAGGDGGAEESAWMGINALDAFPFSHTPRSHAAAPITSRWRQWLHMIARRHAGREEATATPLAPTSTFNGYSDGEDEGASMATARSDVSVPASMALQSPGGGRQTSAGGHPYLPPSPVATTLPSAAAPSPHYLATPPWLPGTATGVKRGRDGVGKGWVGEAHSSAARDLTPLLLATGTAASPCRQDGGGCPPAAAPSPQSFVTDQLQKQMAHLRFGSPPRGLPPTTMVALMAGVRPMSPGGSNGVADGTGMVSSPASSRSPSPRGRGMGCGFHTRSTVPPLLGTKSPITSPSNTARPIPPLHLTPAAAPGALDATASSVATAATLIDSALQMSTLSTITNSTASVSTRPSLSMEEGYASPLGGAAAAAARQHGPPAPMAVGDDVDLDDITAEESFVTACSAEERPLAGAPTSAGMVSMATDRRSPDGDGGVGTMLHSPPTHHRMVRPHGASDATIASTEFQPPPLFALPGLAVPPSPQHHRLDHVDRGHGVGLHAPRRLGPAPPAGTLPDLAAMVRMLELDVQALQDGLRGFGVTIVNGSFVTAPMVATAGNDDTAGPCTSSDSGFSSPLPSSPVPLGRPITMASGQHGGCALPAGLPLPPAPVVVPSPSPQCASLPPLIGKDGGVDGELEAAQEPSSKRSRRAHASTPEAEGDHSVGSSPPQSASRGIGRVAAPVAMHASPDHGGPVVANPHPSPSAGGPAPAGRTIPSGMATPPRPTAWGHGTPLGLRAGRAVDDASGVGSSSPHLPTTQPAPDHPFVSSPTTAGSAGHASAFSATRSPSRIVGLASPSGALGGTPSIPTLPAAPPVPAEHGGDGTAAASASWRGRLELEGACDVGGPPLANIIHRMPVAATSPRAASVTVLHSPPQLHAKGRTSPNREGGISGAVQGGGVMGMVDDDDDDEMVLTPMADVPSALPPSVRAGPDSQAWLPTSCITVASASTVTTTMMTSSGSSQPMAMDTQPSQSASWQPALPRPPNSIIRSASTSSITSLSFHGSGGSGAPRPKSRVRFSTDVLVVEESRRRVRLASYDDLVYNADGTAACNVVEGEKMVAAAAAAHAEISLEVECVTAAGMDVSTTVPLASPRMWRAMTPAAALFASCASPPLPCMAMGVAPPPPAPTGAPPTWTTPTPLPSITVDDDVPMLSQSSSASLPLTSPTKLQPPARASSITSTTSTHRPAPSPIQLALPGCPSPQPFRLVATPILPAGPLQSVHFPRASSLPGAWPRACPSARCLTADPPSYTPISGAFEFRMWHAARRRARAEAMGEDGSVVTACPHGAAGEIDAFHSEDAREALIAALKHAYTAAVTEMRLLYSWCPDDVVALLPGPVVRDVLHVHMRSARGTPAYAEAHRAFSDSLAGSKCPGGRDAEDDDGEGIDEVDEGVEAGQQPPDYEGEEGEGACDDDDVMKHRAWHRL